MNILQVGSVPVQTQAWGVTPTPLLLPEALPKHHKGHRHHRGQLAVREAQSAENQLQEREQQGRVLPPVRRQ